jgi:predicted aldo/keto reductase-like oxidoreductase
MIVPILRNGTMKSRLASIPFLFMCTSSSNAYKLSDRPTLKYGTAWKKDATAGLVEKAIKAGFRHIDTACQPRHYNEAGVGDGWIAAARSLNLDRKELWIQSKFSGINAHDPDNVPYDVDAPLEDRVRQSLEKSLENLKTNYLDSWIMHGPEDNWDDHWKVSNFISMGTVYLPSSAIFNGRRYIIKRCGEQWSQLSMRERFSN